MLGSRTWNTSYRTECQLQRSTRSSNTQSCTTDCRRWRASRSNDPSPPTTSTHIEQLVDTRFLIKPRTFTGAHADWNSWSFDVGASGHAVRPLLEDLIQQALTAGAVLTVSDELNVTLSRQLHHVLVSLTSREGTSWRGTDRVVVLAQGVRTQRRTEVRGNARAIHVLRTAPIIQSVGQLELLIKAHTGESGKTITESFLRHHERITRHAQRKWATGATGTANTQPNPWKVDAMYKCKKGKDPKG